MGRLNACVHGQMKGACTQGKGKILKKQDGDAGGLEKANINYDLNLNLGPDEYVTAVKNQPKPLVIPLCAQLPLPQISPPELYAGTRMGCGFLLESIEGSEKIARYSFVGIDPECTVRVDDEVHISGKDPFTSIAKDPEGTNPVDCIRSVLQRFSYVNIRAPRFFGGMVGYFAYDCIFSLFGQVKNQHVKTAKQKNASPDACFMLTKDCIVFDHLDKTMYIFSSPFLTYESDLIAEYEKSIRRIRELRDLVVALEERKIPAAAPEVLDTAPLHYSLSVSKEAFLQSVVRIKEHIASGDIFQAVLSCRLECAVNGDPFSIYTALREINPSPYMYYLDFGDTQIIGASPEMLVRVENRRVTTVPIAGTRPRGRDTEEDKALAEDLLNDAKERAEHTMLVDLARNDLGRVCRFGTVDVSEFMGIEKFSHVQHIVSTVHGVLKDNLDCYDALKSCFPAGTVSGAPKIRAMQIIGEEEPDYRGLYAGAVGYIGFDRNLEFAIAIRTVVVRDGKAFIQAGAGIVADSVPENEWHETLSKAAAMIRAIERTGGAS
jgi:anthranilate synthase component 1